MTDLDRDVMDAMRAAEEEDVRQWKADRRERIATAALQGLLSNPATSVSPWEIVVAATVYADALIAKLDEEKGEP